MVAARSFYTSDAYAEHYLGIRWPRMVWASVLDQAVRDIVHGPERFEMLGLTPGGEEARVFCLAIREAAEHWVADEVNEPRRFVWVCEQLGLSPTSVRRAISAQGKR